MITREIVVRGIKPDGTPDVKQAMLMVCADCGGATFYLYTVHGHDHPHLQCATCGVSFCDNERCAEGRKR